MHAKLSPHFHRRAALNQRLPAGLLILPTARVKNRNSDCDFQFRFDSNFHYLTGFNEADAVLVQVLGDAPKSILFCQPKNELMEIWEGFIHGPQLAREQYRFDEAYPIAELDQKLIELISNQPRLYWPVGADSAWDKRILDLVEKVKQKSRIGINAPSEFVDIQSILGEMRLFKDNTELDLMRRAAQISSEAHVRAMQSCRPGQFEYEIEAELMHQFYRQGSRSPAYGSIVAGGANATCLHYSQNNARLHDGDLLLIDAGCEIEGYAADITRTFPVNGKFSGPQKDIYELVLAAMHASFEQLKPGNARIAYHDASVRTLTQGLIDLKILKGSVDGLIEQEAFKQFYMHGTGHWLGLDVHDVGAYKLEGQSRPLAAGMALTVEPGLYFRPVLDGAPEHYVRDFPAHFMHIGVRIEDDLVITDTGFENLSAACPKSVADIEAIMQR